MTPAQVIKICGVTCAEDALAAAEAGASAVGFNFWPRSPRHIEPDEAARIAALLPDTLLKVGVFVDDTADRVAAIGDRVRLDVAQMHGGTMPPGGGLRYWCAFAVSDNGAPAIHDAGDAEAILLDTAFRGLRGGTGRTFSWQVARALERPVIIAGGLDAGNVREAVRQAQPWGVDSCSRIESAPGRKDHAKMKAFILEALEALS